MMALSLRGVKEKMNVLGFAWLGKMLQTAA